jgi:hypothetical protein
MVSIKIAARSRSAREGRRLTSGPPPEFESDGHWIDLDGLPPSSLVAYSVEVAMMNAAERDGKLIADPTAECSRLSEAEVVRITWSAATHQARLPRDILAVLLIA